MPDEQLIQWEQEQREDGFSDFLAVDGPVKKSAKLDPIMNFLTNEVSQ